MPQVAAAFKHFAGTYFPVFEVSGLTLALQAACASVVAVAAAIVPAWRASRVRIVEGLRAIG
jgi:putative ABC transport system permease protein